MTRYAMTADPGQIASRRAWEALRRFRADPVQAETLTTQQVRRVCTAGNVSALASDPQTVGAAPPGWHGLRYAAPSGMDP